MLARSPSEQRSQDRMDRVRQIVSELLRQRAAGEDISDGCILGRHPELMPDLACELQKLRSIGDALDLAEEQQCSRAMRRIEADAVRDRASFQDTDDDRVGGKLDERDNRLPAAHEHPSEKYSTGDRAAPWSSDAGSDREDWPNRADPVAVPRTIGRYRVVDVLADGGFGRVYLARDEQLARDVAIKVPHRHRITEPKAITAYLTEARIVAGLDHPSIVPVYDVGRLHDGSCYVVSKLIRGKNLAERIGESRLPHDEAVRLVIAVAGALQYAHSSGLVHRDIKPANILLDKDGKPFVTDFGLALHDEDSGLGRSFAGTPAYMSPEQARGEAHRVDGRSDIFSLGVVLYELVTGSKPFCSASYDDLLQQIIWTDPIPPHRVDESVPTELERICLKSLSKRAADRYATVAEMIEDLRHFSDRAGPQASPTTVGAHATADTRVDPGKADSPICRVVPRGLRPFDAGDAEYFLELVPGPRDRNGLPESVRLWKNRIEELDPDETCAVGLIYGPSGCGKSSLVRAGLLPRISPHVQPVYIEATADDTESRISKRLQKRYPQLPSDAGLAECLAAVRRGRCVAQGQKLLLVIDQFEQWLHGRGESDRRLLVQALRQCDGGRVQCLILVRDDFWLALSRFMAELEVDLVQGHNTTLVDLFDPSHAEKVLAAFGRSYGQLPDGPGAANNAQQTFLQRAVAGLSEEDKVVPVRLALFAEMVKGRSWTPVTLRDVGGAAGIGVTFLEETFSARTANPQHRMHERAARAVLEALLPEPGSNMKGHIRTDLELLDISGYGKNPRAFKELMRILDSETRLLTPTDPEGMDALDVPPAPDGRYYQLTHDYLVPSLRQWLRKKQRSTRVGRAELCLAERSMIWNARPERRQLPSVWEWLAIRLRTRSVNWTPVQRKMMRVAARHHALVSATVMMLAVFFLFAGVEMTGLARNLLVQFRASTAVLWLVAGREEAVWPLLKESPDPTLRTGVIHGLSPLLVSPDEVIDQLQDQADPSIRSAMLLVAGELVGDPENRTNRWAVLRQNDPLIQELVQIYRDDPDPGVHAAAQWALGRYEQESQTALIDSQLVSAGITGDRQWYVNSQDHTMVVVPGPESFSMGSPSTEASRGEDEDAHNRWIRRSFCIASMETTVEQFQRFLRENQQIQQWTVVPADLSPRAPQTSVTWYEAAGYCNWLSQKDGIPKEQWCYEANADGAYAEGMQLTLRWQDLRGYRLPSEAEWEYACRAGTTTARHIGRVEAHLEHYATYLGLSDGGPLKVGRRKPNDFGLFDTYGNVSEWCQDRYRLYPDNRSATASLGAQQLDNGQSRVLRGGSFEDPQDLLRSAARAKAPPTRRDSSIGFRVARTYP